MNMIPITILGCGAWGGTIAQALADEGHSIRSWGKFPEEIDQLNSTRIHSNISGLQFSESIKFTADLKEALYDAQIIIIAIPSQTVRNLISQIQPLVSGAMLIVNLSKGIEKSSLMTMSQVIHDEGDFDPQNIV